MTKKTRKRSWPAPLLMALAGALATVIALAASPGVTQAHDADDHAAACAEMTDAQRDLHDTLVGLVGGDTCAEPGDGNGNGGQNGDGNGDGNGNGGTPPGNGGTATCVFPNAPMNLEVQTLDNNPELSWDPPSLEVANAPAGTTYQVEGYVLSRTTYQNVPGSAAADLTSMAIEDIAGDAVSYRDQGLPYSSYVKYRIKARVKCTAEDGAVANDDSPWSDEVTTTLSSSGGLFLERATRPDAPQLLDAMFVPNHPDNMCRGADLVTLTWAAPENAGREAPELTGDGQYVGGNYTGGDNASRIITGEDATIKRYEVERRVVGSGLDWTLLGSVDPSQDLEYDDTSVIFGTSYQYRVTVVNSADLTNNDTEIESIPAKVAEPAAPAEPTSLVAVVLTDQNRNIELQWDPPAEAQDEAVVDRLFYEIRRRAESDSAADWTTLETIQHEPAVGADGANDLNVVRTQEFTDDYEVALKPTERGEVLTYQVRAVIRHADDPCVQNESDWLEADSDAAAPNIPGIPAAPVVSATTDTSITLSWTAPTTTGGVAITGYRLERKDGDVFTPIFIGDGTSHTDMGLVPSTMYEYRVSATNQHGDSQPSETVTATTTAKPLEVGAPDITDFSAGDGSVTVTWTDGANAVGHLVLLLDGGFEQVAMNAAPTGNTVTFDGLAPDTYTVVVVSYASADDYVYKTETGTVQ